MATIQPPSTGGTTDGDTTPVQQFNDPIAGLRNRKPNPATAHTTKTTSSSDDSYKADDEDNADDADDKKSKDAPEVTWGKTPDGKGESSCFWLGKAEGYCGGRHTT